MSKTQDVIEEAVSDYLPEDVEEEILHDATYAPNRFMEACLRPLRRFWIAMDEALDEFPDNVEGANR